MSQNHQEGKAMHTPTPWAAEKIDFRGEPSEHDFYINARNPDDSGDVQTVTRTFDGATPDVSEMTNYANWFAYYRTRITATKSVTSLTFSELNDKSRVGFHNLYNLASFVNIADFSAAQKAIWFNQLFGVQIPLGQETPSLTAVARIGEYFLNGTHPQLAGSSDPIVLDRKSVV